MRLVPVFTLKTNNQTNNECLPKFVQTHNASSSIKTAIVVNFSLRARQSESHHMTNCDKKILFSINSENDEGSFCATFDQRARSF